MIMRAIPSSNEIIPVIGLGTWKQFDIGSSPEEWKPRFEVLKKMSEEGSTLIDSSPMYGRSEEVVGDLTNESGEAEQFFYATKVWTTGEQEGINQMNDSMRKMRRTTMDLMQIHNLVDWKTHLKTMNRWKAEGEIRYTGITHYTVSSHDELERIIKTTKLDFVQFNYSIRTRNAEKSLLNAARDNGVAVIINEPLEKGSLFNAVKRISPPEWSNEYDINNWGEFFLKYIIAHPAVTCVIPATSNAMHMADNMRAGFGKLPDEKGRKRMIEFIEKL
jgi:diketogulonate reductase-like aldo/keto reductase